MRERVLTGGEFLERQKEATKKYLQDIARRSGKPSFYDRLALPVDRLIGNALARVYGIPGIKEQQDPE